jgi:hypothetical protein
MIDIVTSDSFRERVAPEINVLGEPLPRSDEYSQGEVLLMAVAEYYDLLKVNYCKFEKVSEIWLLPRYVSSKRL